MGRFSLDEKPHLSALSNSIEEPYRRVCYSKSSGETAAQQP